MPVDRLIHPRLGHSLKVSQLSHLEARVWFQYLMSADDFGVMRYSALTIQESNAALAAEPMEVIKLALDTILRVGLVRTFQHQGRAFLFQHDWQDWQKVEYPRASLLPKPLPAGLKGCSEKTRLLFLKHPGGNPKSSQKVSQTIPEELPSNARADAPAKRLTANGLRLEANGKRQTADGFDRFWSAYPRKESKADALRLWTKLKPAPDLQGRIMAALETQSRGWTEVQFIPHPDKWLRSKRWEDETPDLALAGSPTLNYNLGTEHEAIRLVQESEARRGR